MTIAIPASTFAILDRRAPADASDMLRARRRAVIRGARELLTCGPELRAMRARRLMGGYADLPPDELLDAVRKCIRSERERLRNHHWTADANRLAGLRQLGAALLAQRIGEAAAQQRGRIAA
jgi:hypothetical protein